VPVNFHTEKTPFNLKQKLKLKRWITQWLDSHDRTCGQLDFIFTSNRHIRKINRKYLNHDYNTDVITFDYGEGKKISGDIFISIDQVKRNAGDFQTQEEEELRRVMIHGVNHLLGYDDRSEEERTIMRQMENEALHLWMKMV
jgi:rRNA maturation RNase YbeY